MAFWRSKTKVHSSGDGFKQKCSCWRHIMCSIALLQDDSLLKEDIMNMEEFTDPPVDNESNENFINSASPAGRGEPAVKPRSSRVLSAAHTPVAPPQTQQLRVRAAFYYFTYEVYKQTYMSFDPVDFSVRYSQHARTILRHYKTEYIL
ncbi:hypothetical protein RR46_01230 [Papilio xuthus]|uniref:Uncharacterized protein n=1 Tax=Papilio xuthus TaxID=66420 RepID=A0A0N1IE05_PAPXU|nr:hypothetical protein RR46_01230 [Papilio xuthus]